MKKLTLGTLVSTAAVGLGVGGYNGFCHAQNISPSESPLLRFGLFFGPAGLGFMEGTVAGSLACDEEREVADVAAGYAVLYTILGLASTVAGYGLGYLAGHFK